MRQSLGHRPLHLGAPEHRTFLDQTAERLERLASQGVDVRQELRDVQRQLVALPPPKPVQVPVVEFDDDEERIDIGEATASEAVDNAPATQPTQVPTGRPERRDGRRNDRGGRGNQEHRTGREAAIEAQPKLAPLSAAPVEAAASASAIDTETSELPLAGDGPFSTEEASSYPAKKKKRRSRGGAKRTARKNAARLAAGQADGLAQEELEEELALENPALTLEEVSEQPALTEPVLDIAEPEAATISAEEGSSEATGLNRRRGAGPTPKKSKVITKSSQVKRGQRSSLYRTPAPEAADSAATTVPEAVTASAPIISPPIIPVALSERPAVELAEPPQLHPEAATPVVAEPDLAATVLGLYSSKPQAVAAAKPKRGRPKAAAEATPTTEAAPAVAPSAETATTSTEAADSPTDAAPVAKPTKKPAARASKAAKPAAPKKAVAKASKPAAAKKTTAKPAATRRGRPPGTTTAPAADEPVA